MEKELEYVRLLNKAMLVGIQKNLFVIEGGVALLEDEKVEESRNHILEIISGASRKISLDIQIWKEYECIGETFWQDIENAITRARCSFPKRIEAKVDVIPGKVNANNLFPFVLENLIENTIKHSGKEFPKVSISSQVEGDYILLVYEDDGIGIDFLKKEEIFKQHYGKNTFFGLFFAREIIKMMDGTIKEVGIPGQCARFEIRIPLQHFRFCNKGAVL